MNVYTICVVAVSSACPRIGMIRSPTHLVNPTNRLDKQ